MTEPAKIVPKDNSDYLRVMTRAVFQSGFNWAVIENKWPGFEEAFDKFDPTKVASYSDSKVADLCEDKRIVRNGSKINATVHNARTLLAKEAEYGSFKKYLSSFDNFDAAVKGISKSFKWMGEFAAYYFLYVVGEPTPTHEEWMKTHKPKTRSSK